MTQKEFSYQLVGMENSLKRFAYSLTTDTDDANDLLQETYLKALTNREKFTHGDNLKAWTFTIMRNTFINEYRRNSKRRVSRDESENQFQLNTGKAETNDTPDSRIAVKEIMRNIDSLDEDFGKPLKMYYEGYKYKEIADILNLNIGTVKSKIFFSRKKLGEQMSEYKAA
jgi:RNA polymerase sigma-70 factor (ECF subfamily)